MLLLVCHSSLYLIFFSHVLLVAQIPGTVNEQLPEWVVVLEVICLKNIFSAILFYLYQSERKKAEDPSHTLQVETYLEVG